MQILRTLFELQTAKATWGPVGFVPTMGALHKGHLSLVKMAKEDGLWPVVSIFINPIQFSQSADFAAYPIRTETDIALLEAAGCKALFMPSTAEMYAESVQLRFDFGHLDTVLEGSGRPGHFSGVGVVVSRLFHLIGPTKAYFGQKDLQQLAVVKRLVKDLAFPLDIVSCPTSRDPDGLALSSRNLRLSPTARALAPQLYENLKAAWEHADNIGVASALAACKSRLAEQSAFIVHYVEAINPYTFEVMSEQDEPARGPLAIALAASIEGIRLIDNMVRWE